MRTYLRGKITLLFMTCAVLLAIPAIALADNVQTNDVDTGGNATKEVGASGNASVRIVGNNAPSGDISGCNVDAANPATVGFTVSQPSKLTIGSAQVTACGNAGLQSVAYQVTSSAQAGDVITVTTSTTGGKTGSKWNESSFTVTVTGPSTPADTTPPVLTLPSNITAEATGADGATVTYSASAEDAVDGPVEIICTPASGATFTLGPTTVNCSASDAAGNTANGSFTVTVEDTIGPALDLPQDITREATGPSGATVDFTATATDVVDGSRPVNCTPNSGATFPLGVTTVNCSASDTRGNESTGSFTVTVQDTTAPELTVPTDITREATGPSGAAVDYSADVSATDLVDGNVQVTCNPESGSTFELGTTTVTCTAIDDSGNTTTRNFTVTVRDTTGPALSLPANITTTAPSNSQATVNFTATANDLVDGSRPVSCDPASGSSFSAGTTTVNCSSTDSRGNSSTGSFTVTVNYGFTGFFQPIDNKDPITHNYIPNKAKSGSVIPVKFSLGGDQGLNIFYTGDLPKVYPTVVGATGCATGTADLVEEYASANASGLKYDPLANQYIYNWKTQSNYAGKCLMLNVKLADGKTYSALFSFVK